ncbi:MAG: hypothetical protein Q9166_001049 [cf. Caloplaca sp. 2 TL-2023]
MAKRYRKSNNEDQTGLEEAPELDDGEDAIQEAKPGHEDRFSDRILARGGSWEGRPYTEYLTLAMPRVYKNSNA